MNTHDYDQPVAAVMAAERKRRPYPLRAQDHKDLFEEFARLNPGVMREIELTALSIDSRGMRVSTKYLIERQRYEGRERINPVPYEDTDGTARVYSINNNITPLLARWLLERHPDMRIETRRSFLDEEES